MKLCHEYGTEELASPNSDSYPKSTLVSNLTYTQALILLGIPEEEREEFIENHDVESMTKLELQQAVKDRDQAIQEKKDLQKNLDVKNSEITQLTAQTKSLEEQMNQCQAEKVQSSISKADEQFTIHRDVILNAWKELSQILSTLNKIDPKIKETYREQLHTMLQNLTKRMEVWPPIVTTNLSIKPTPGVKSSN
ncbi:DUF3102 domain-containing protein [Desulfosporosinus hippei]|uniref:Uncharacterized protein n=1 Tax=Desulfosporosinus hippei DSM 8344 TaxID=1121419 RepID=A0A1G8GSL7_9FIRM|nr:DUF3102 domain-containing protein [Desulfosporosinus hippei]SDH97405.1 Protein of unknown function [Desulfosporosinus hippei DSM 8344]